MIPKIMKEQVIKMLKERSHHNCKNCVWLEDPGEHSLDKTIYYCKFAVYRRSGIDCENWAGSIPNSKPLLPREIKELRCKDLSLRE